jgi:hypothetical protein
MIIKICLFFFMLIYLPTFPNLVKSILTFRPKRGICSDTLQGGTSKVCKMKNGFKTIYINDVAACSEANVNLY